MKHKNTSYFKALFLAALALPIGTKVAQAEQGDELKYWLGGGAQFFEADDPNEPGQLYEIRLGYDLDPAFTVEGGLGGSPFMEGNDYNAPDPKEATFQGRNSPGENWSLKTNVGLLYHLDQSADRQFDPYVSAIAGTQFFGKQRYGQNWEPFAGPGLGVAYWVDKDLGLRLDYNVVMTTVDAEINHHVLAMVHYDWGSGDDQGGAGEGQEGRDAAQQLGAKSNGPLKTIYFDFDKSNLTSQSQQTLDDNAAWIKANPASKVSLEGHTDERGTNEYNAALGQRRAKSALDYLRNKGIPAQQLNTTSFGEEFPADPGHNEGAWSKNRRVESVVK